MLRYFAEKYFRRVIPSQLTVCTTLSSKQKDPHFRERDAVSRRNAQDDRAGGRQHQGNAITGTASDWLRPIGRAEMHLRDDKGRNSRAPPPALDIYRGKPFTGIFR